MLALIIGNYNFIEATNNFTKLGTATGVKWPAQISVILSELKDGNTTKASAHYSEFQSDNKIPDNVKKWFSKEYAILLKNPHKLNNLSEFSQNMIKLFLAGKFTLNTAQEIKNIMAVSGDFVVRLVGGLK